MAILAAVDGERENDRVVSVGADLAAAADDELHVLHVMSQTQFDEIQASTDQGSIGFVVGEANITSVDTGDDAEEYYLDDATDDAAAIAEHVVDGTLESAENVTASGRVGDPAEEILEEARRIDARYVVIGGRKRSPVGKAVFGSITQSVLLDADQPVMTVFEEA